MENGKVGRVNSQSGGKIKKAVKQLNFFQNTKQ